MNTWIMWLCLVVMNCSVHSLSRNWATIKKKWKAYFVVSFTECYFRGHTHSSGSKRKWWSSLFYKRRRTKSSKTIIISINSNVTLANIDVATHTNQKKKFTEKCRELFMGKSALAFGLIWIPNALSVCNAGLLYSKFFHRTHMKE